MKKIFIIILTFLYSLNVFSQDQECGTHDPTEAEMQALPWYGNNAWLEQYVDSLAQTFNNCTNCRVEGGSEVWYRVPVQFVVARWGQDVIERQGRNTDKTLKAMIFHLNRAMRENNIPIRFYTECTRFLDDNEAATGTINSLQACTSGRFTENASALTCYIINDSPNFSGIHCRYSNNIVFVEAFFTTDLISEYGEVEDNADEGNSTFIHEVGHWLGLEHTHLYDGIPCQKEPVNRGVFASLCNGGFPLRHCEVRGDALCDTPADPDLSKHETDVMSDCSWYKNIKDDRGDFYEPDTKNYMSYNQKTICRRKFSRQQGIVALNGIKKQMLRKNTTFPVNLGNDFDFYEPDNFPTMASQIDFNETQIHSFSVVGSCGTNDASDWLKFNNGANDITPYTNNLILEVESIDGFNFPVLEVEMWDGGFAEISNYRAPNNISRLPYTQTNIQPSKITYTIPCTLPIGRTYLFRVVRNGNQTGRYQITLKKLPNNITINGSDIVCNNLVSFSATSTQVGINIPFSWEVSTNLQIVSGQGTNAIMVSPINPNVGGTGFVRLVYNNICIGQQQVQKNIWVGKPAITSGLMDANFQPITEATLYISEPCPDNNPPRPTHLPVACFNGFGTQGYNNIFEIEDIIGNASQYYSLESTSSIPRGCIRFFQTGYYEFRVRAKNTNCINTNSDWLVFRITVMEDPNLPQCIDPDPIPPDVCYDEWGQAYLCPSGYRYYPNISQGDLNIDYSENYQKLEIYNKYNQKVFETNLDKKKGRKLNLRKLPNDVYFLHLIDKKGLSVKKQLVIQK